MNKNAVRKIKKKKYRTFPVHIGVQPISSILSSLEFDTPWKDVPPSYVTNLLSSKNLLGMPIPIFAHFCS
jgi:hypothetical protein